MKTEENYFNLTCNGIGYLNRLRTVNPKKATPYLAVSLSALEGPKNDVNNVYFDLMVSGKQAKDTIEILAKAIEAKQKVLVGFSVGSIRPDSYEYNGETKLVIKGRLLKIRWAKVDGEAIAVPQEEDDEADSRRSGLSAMGRSLASTVCAVLN
jgi:hypothetical protein